MPIFTRSKTGLKLTTFLLIFIVFLQLVSPLFLLHARAADESADVVPNTENVQPDKQEPLVVPEDSAIKSSEEPKVVDGTGDAKEGSDQLGDSAAQTSSVGGASKVLNDRSVVKTDLPKVDQVTGALSFAVPIATPPGRGGVQPDIALQYNSQDKNIFSPFGYGWSLNISYIKRYQAPGALNQYSTDTYESSLVGKLVLAQTQPGDGRKLFQPRIEQGQPWQFYLGQDDVWTVYDAAGHTYRFGGAVSARQDLLQLVWMEYLRSVFPAYDISTAQVKIGDQSYTAYIKRDRGKSDPVAIALYLDNASSFTADKAFSLLDYRQGSFMTVDATGLHGVQYLPKPAGVAYQFALSNVQETPCWLYSHYSYLYIG